MEIPSETLKNIYYRMNLARFFEEQLLPLYREKTLHGTTHLAMGQEATAIGAGAALKKGDLMVATHRGHAQALGAGMEAKYIMAELFGKTTGCAKGKGGSMHLADIKNGILGSNGVVGGGFPIACGAAFTQKYKKTGQAVLCFGGEGSTQGGNFHESLNMAALWNLPVVFFIENNFYAISMSMERQTKIDHISRRAEAYDMPGLTIDGNDVTEVYEITARALEHARSGQGPVLIEAQTYRLNGHSKSDKEVYRDAAEVAEWRKEDPIFRFEEYLEAENLIDGEELDDLRYAAREAVEQAIDFAERSPAPDVSAVFEDVYAGGGR